MRPGQWSPVTAGGTRGLGTTLLPSPRRQPPRSGSPCPAGRSASGRGHVHVISQCPQGAPKAKRTVDPQLAGALVHARVCTSGAGLGAASPGPRRQGAGQGLSSCVQVPASRWPCSAVPGQGPLLSDPEACTGGGDQVCPASGSDCETAPGVVSIFTFELLSSLSKVSSA